MHLNIINTDKINVCFLGDMHGNMDALSQMVKRTDMNNVLYIGCGDIGLGFDKPENYKGVFNRLSKTAHKYDVEFMFLRGNHDDPSYFDGKKINRKYIKAIPDYTVICTPIWNILCVGGAISIDRTNRVCAMRENALKYSVYHNCTIETAELSVPKYYWSDESPVYDEEALNGLNEKKIKIDVLAAHTCPSFAPPLSKDGIKWWLRVDPNLNEDLVKERDIMDLIYHKLKNDGHPLKKWIYGHYHNHTQQYIDNVQFVMLDMCRNGILDVFEMF